MIELTFGTLQTDNDESKMLLAAMSILTSSSFKSSELNYEFGTKSSPNNAFDNVKDLANKIFYEEEYKKHTLFLDRRDKISRLTNDSPLPGEVWRHYKGGIYEIISMSINTETNEDMVVYKSKTNKLCYSRPLSIWSEYVGDKKRFTRIDD